MANNMGSGLMEMSLDDLRSFPTIVKKKKKKKKKRIVRGIAKNSKSTAASSGLGILTESGGRLVTESGSSLARG